MPHPLAKANFHDVREMVSELDTIKLTKPELGTLGIPKLAEVVAQLKKEMSVIVTVADDASDQQLQDATVAYREYIQLLYKIEGLRGSEFAREREGIGESLIVLWDKIRQVWPPFAALAFARSGLLEDPQSAHEMIRIAAQEGEDAIRAVTKQLLDQADAEAKRIENNARKTAQQFSIKAAQDQFDSASTLLIIKSVVCGVISATSFAAFISFAFHIYNHPPIFLMATSGSQSVIVSNAIYLTAIRITILTAIGAITTFSLRMLRAYLHMSEFNDHRRRIANSMAAFVESAQSSEQRDLVFGRLVDSIVVFGDSGILSKDADGLSVPSVVIDAVTKNLTSK